MVIDDKISYTISIPTEDLSTCSFFQRQIDKYFISSEKCENMRGCVIWGKHLLGIRREFILITEFLRLLRMKGREKERERERGEGERAGAREGQRERQTERERERETEKEKE